MSLFFAPDCLTSYWILVQMEGAEVHPEKSKNMIGGVLC